MKEPTVSFIPPESEQLAEAKVQQTEANAALRAAVPR